MRVRARVIVVALLIGLVAGTVAPAAAASPGGGQLDRAAVDAYVTRYLQRNGLPGASIAVVRNGAVLYEAGYGRDAHGQPITPRTLLAVASVSKSFTAFAVLQLVDAGRIDLDEPVVSYLPGFAVADPRGSQITVRQLLSHTSGLPDPVIVPPADTLQQAVARTRDWQLIADPGTQYSYSNANYWIAARLVEVVSGQPFAGYLERHVFTPLGMVDTRTVATVGGGVDGLAGGHVTAYGTALSLPTMEQFVAGSGGVVSTAHDMARWLAMQTNRGVGPDGSVLLAPGLVEQSHTAQPGTGGAYGLGWSLSGPGIVPQRVSHSGSLPRYSAQVDLIPSSGYGVAVLLNSFTPTLEHPYEISFGIIAIIRGGTPTPGLAIPTLIDAALGLVTLAVIALAIRGLARWRTWRFGLRLAPHAIAPGVAVLVFLVVPLQAATATPVDVFGLWPALMILVLTLATAGVALGAARIIRRFEGPSATAGWAGRVLDDGISPSRRRRRPRRAGRARPAWPPRSRSPNRCS